MEDKINIFSKEILSHVALLKHYAIINFKSHLEYKTSFIIQIISMILNDIIWIFFWWMFFARFPVLNDWTYKDLLLLWAICATSYAISGIIFGNRNNLPEIISQGKLDYYLTLPKNVLLHTLISRMGGFSFGDLIFGLVLAVILLEIQQLPIFILLVLLSSILLTSFGVISGTFAFFIGNSEKLSSSFWNATTGLAIYPANVYEGLSKLILFTVIPIGFIGAVPVEILRNFSSELTFWMVIVTAITTTIAILLFHIGLKKYESGNQIYVNT